MSDILFNLRTRSTRRKLVDAALAFVLAAAATRSVHAQSAELDEIVVSATKRNTTIQETPLDVSALDAKTLSNLQVEDLQDVARNIPGISFTNTLPGQSVLVLRGISPIGGQPTVGLYLDDIPMTGTIGLLQGMSEPRLLDVDRVEVLRGPQGTLYGASAMGGAIKLVSVMPDPSEFTGVAKAGVDEVDHGGVGYHGEAVLNIPLIDDRLAIRLGGGYRLEGGYIDRVAGGDWENVYLRTNATTLAPVQTPTGNTVNENDINDTRVTQGKAALLLKPSDNTELVASVNSTKTEYGDIGEYWGNLGKFRQSNLLAQPVDEDLTVGDVSFTANLESVQFTSLTGYFHSKIDLTADYSFYIRSLLGPAGLGALFANIPSDRVQANAQDTWSQEFRLASGDKNSRLQWLIGVFGADTKTKTDPRISSFGISGLVPAFLASSVAGDVVFGADARSSIDDYAVFGEATYALTDRLSLTLGARYFQDRNTSVSSSFGLLAGGTVAPVTIRSDEDGVTPKFTASYKLDEDHLLYSTASKGFRPGGPNSAIPLSECGADLAKLGLTAAPNKYVSDSLWNYEIGSKNQFLDRRMTLNGTAYYIDWSKIQQTVSLDCGFPYIANVGKAYSKGLEFEFEALLTDRLLAGLGAALARTDITQTSMGVTAQVGQDVLGVPDTVLNGYIQYTLPVSADYALRARVDNQYRSSQLMNFSSTINVNIVGGGTAIVPNPAQVQGALDLTGLSFGLQAKAYDLTLYVHNVFDRSDVMNAYVLLHTPQVSAPQPRTIGLDAAYRF